VKARCVSLRRLGTLSFLLFAGYVAAVAQNPSGSVFKIGSFDRSSADFASGTPAAKVNFIVSQSKPEKDWFAYHPAVLASAAKSAGPATPSAPRSITFSLSGPRAAAYRLHVAVLIESPSVPVLHVEINGKSGLFYLHPKLEYSNGDQVDSFDPVYSAADIEFDFPGSYLHSGSNSILLQPIMEAAEAVPDAGLNYDAIELAVAPSRPERHLLSAELAPTVFFQQDASELKECVEAFIRFNQPISSGSADLSVTGKHYRADLRGRHDFGEVRLHFLVSEFAPKTEAQLSLTVNGYAQTYHQTIDPKKKWTILVVPHIHTDVGYSDYQAKVAAIHGRVIDEAVKMSADHPDFRFTLDGQWDLQQFLDTRTAAQTQKAIAAFRSKRLYLPAQYANLLTGISSNETLIRSLYPSANFSRAYGTPFNFANITDVPTCSWSYASILASAGIPYFAIGSDNYRGPVLLQGRLNEGSPFWWLGPDNKRVLVWYSRHYMQMQFLFGLPPLPETGEEIVPLFLQMYDHPNYSANSVILFGTQVENTDLFPQQAELAKKWNALYAYPRLEYSGFYEAMEAIEKQSGGDIPTVRGDGGSYWEDGAGSDSYYLALERNNEARGQTAEKLATLASLNDPAIRANPDELTRMWNDMVMMDEHTWDSYNSVTDPVSREAVDQLTLKEHWSIRAAASVDFITRRGMANLANVISTGTGSVVVFNSLNWQRTGRVCRDFDKGTEIVDPSTNQPLPVEVTLTGSDFHRVCFVAQDVPAIGYRVYATRPTKTEPDAPNAELGTTLESPYYKVELDPETGSIRGIFDKRLNRELVNRQSSYHFGQYLYVTGGDKLPNTLLHYDRISSKPELEIHAAAHGKLVSVVHTPSGLVACLESRALNTPLIKTEVRLFDNAKKIEIVQDIDKTEVTTKEAAYFAFPFDMSQPQFQYEIQNGVVDPAHDMYPGAGHEWFTTQHWVSVQQDGISATILPLDAPLLTLGDINRGAWPEQFGNRTGNIFSYAMNNYWDTNYRAGQGGHFTFRYIVTSDASTDPVTLSRIGWEEATPLESDIITTQDKALAQPSPNQPSGSTQAAATSTSGLDTKQASFFIVQDPSLLLETWKPAEDGNGTILRFLDLGGADRTVDVRIPHHHLIQASQTDAVERGETALPIDSIDRFHFAIHPHEIVTIRLVSSRE
jgi:alpha-mannosidase